MVFNSCSSNLCCCIDQSESLAGVTKREGRNKGKQRSERLRYLIWATDCQAVRKLEQPNYLILWLNSIPWVPRGWWLPENGKLHTFRVLLLCLLQNHPFSNLGFSGRIQQIFVKLDFAVSKWPKFNYWSIFSSDISYLIPFRPHQTLCHCMAFWVGLASTKGPLHLGMVLCNYREESRLPYLIWKSMLRAFIWTQILKA